MTRRRPAPAERLATVALLTLATFPGLSSAAPRQATPGAQPTGAPTVQPPSRTAAPKPPTVVDPGTPISGEQLRQELLSPEEARKRAVSELERARRDNKEAQITYHSGVIERIDSIRRDEQVSLTLEEVLRRTLANNYTIQVLSYNPAVETTRVVEAEALFDAVLFTTAGNNKIDRPTASQLASAGAEVFNLNVGIRKLLPAGTLVTGQYGLNRSKQSFSFQTLNPAYTSSFSLDIRQPLLRGYGIDLNRSTILIARNNRRMSDLAFRRQVRDTLRSAEELYWRLVQARRDVVITALEVADFEEINQYLDARKDFDVLPVSIYASRADLEAARVDFVRRRGFMLDAEDRLIAAMNDPEINLIDNIELVPTDFPTVERIVIDRLAEVQSALDNRTEIHEQELVVANAKVFVGQAKNNQLPQLDLAVTTTFQGLGASADRSFDEVTRGNFINYEISVQFELPIGNRAPRAARRRAELQHGQAMAELRRVLEDIILDVNLAARQVETSYDQINPSFASVLARRRELESHIARAERKDVGTLNTELGARRALAGTRRALLNAIVDCNIALTDLERAKGTLLQYNNVVIPTEGH